VIGSQKVLKSLAKQMLTIEQDISNQIYFRSINIHTHTRSHARAPSSAHPRSFLLNHSNMGDINKFL